jgi:hypothetical protein
LDVRPAGRAPLHGDGPEDFETDDGKIGCNYIPVGGNGVYHSPDGGAELVCDRAAPLYVRYSLLARGAARLDQHVRDTGCCGGPVLEAGSVWSGGPFQCSANLGAITCVNADRRGFTLTTTTPR